MLANRSDLVLELFEVTALKCRRRHNEHRHFSNELRVSITYESRMVSKTQKRRYATQRVGQSNVKFCEGELRRKQNKKTGPTKGAPPQLALLPVDAGRVAQ